MTTDPRAALDRLVDALQVHLAASAARRGSSDPAVVAAYDTLADAFETYDEALFDAYGETTPFELYDEDEDLDDEDDEESDDPDDPDDLGGDDDDFDDHVDDELEDRLGSS
jgi:hypothetical protein